MQTRTYTKELMLPPSTVKHAAKQELVRDGRRRKMFCRRAKFYYRVFQTEQEKLLKCYYDCNTVLERSCTEWGWDATSIMEKIGT
jgi:hypothetical protein